MYVLDLRVYKPFYKYYFTYRLFVPLCRTGVFLIFIYIFLAAGDSSRPEHVYFSVGKYLDSALYCLICE